MLPQSLNCDTLVQCTLSHGERDHQYFYARRTHSEELSQQMIETESQECFDIYSSEDLQIWI